MSFAGSVLENSIMLSMFFLIFCFKESLGPFVRRLSVWIEFLRMTAELGHTGVKKRKNLPNIIQDKSHFFKILKRKLKRSLSPWWFGRCWFVWLISHYEKIAFAELPYLKTDESDLLILTLKSWLNNAEEKWRNPKKQKFGKMSIFYKGALYNSFTREY